MVKVSSTYRYQNAGGLATDKKVTKVDSIKRHKIGKQLLFNNKIIQFKGKVLNFKKWREKGLITLQDIFKTEDNRFMTLVEIQDLIDQNRAITLFQYNALMNAIPPIWINWIMENDTYFDGELQQNAEAKYFDTKPKYIKIHLSKITKSTPIVPQVVGMWNRKLNFEINEDVWLMPRRATKEVRLRELQWKILHNIYPTNILLQKMGVCNARFCDYCPNTVDVIEHFFFECTPVRIFWRYIEDLFSASVGQRTHLTVNEVMFGHEVSTISNQNLWINHILLVGKMCISRIKKTKSTIQIKIAFEQEAQIRKLL